MRLFYITTAKIPETATKYFLFIMLLEKKRTKGGWGRVQKNVTTITIIIMARTKP